jgi:predicted RNA-binding protein with PIN domain
VLYIDGYNLLFKCHPHHLSLQEAREKLILELDQLFTLLKREAYIVFDAMYQKNDLSHYSLKSVHIIYTAHKESADDYLYHLVAHSASPSLYTIITSDKKVQTRVKLLGGKILSLDSFLLYLHKKKKKLPTSAASFTPATVSVGSIAYYKAIFEERLQSLEDFPHDT